MWLFKALGAVGDIVQWFIGYGQRKIGKEEQQNEDAQDTNTKLKAELDAANNSQSASDELRDGKF